jgi:hypothetical protein
VQVNDLKVSDALWDRNRPLLPVAQRRRRWPGRKPMDDRACLNGILFVPATGIRTDHPPITRRMLGVDLVGSRRIWPAHVGCAVGPDGSRPVLSDRLDAQREIKGHPMLNRMQGKQRQGLSGQLNAQGGHAGAVAELLGQALPADPTLGSKTAGQRAFLALLTSRRK